MVTWHQLGVLLLGIVGVLMLAGGMLSVFAGMMSDAPSEDDGKAGCITGVIGLLMVAAAIAWGFL